MPAIIDKVLNVTQLPKVLFIGYSMGATSFFTMICQKPEYNDKLVAFVGLAPAVYMDNIRQIAEFGLKTMDFPVSLIILRPSIGNELNSQDQWVKY